MVPICEKFTPSVAEELLDIALNGRSARIDRVDKIDESAGLRFDGASPSTSGL